MDIKQWVLFLLVYICGGISGVLLTTLCVVNSKRKENNYEKETNDEDTTL